MDVKMGISRFLDKPVRTLLVAVAALGTMLTMSGTALADQGGNGEGKLEVYATATATGKPAASLSWGGTYYIELLNPGGRSQLNNITNGPNSIKFNFFNPPRTFQGDPGHWNTNGSTFTVTGTQTQKFIYKITLPTKPYTEGNYTIEAGPISMHKNHGEDEVYFANDPNIGGVININTPPAGQLPEVPYAGMLPLLVLLGGGYLYIRRSRRQGHQV
jgi:hypothetical protein